MLIMILHVAFESSQQFMKSNKNFLSTNLRHPDPSVDWITQRELAQLLSVSERTASLWAKAGRLQIFEHGVTACGRRKYSRALIARELKARWNRAVARQARMNKEISDQ